jgi:nicotinic acid mononucleotide adenylyltransferase
MDAYDLSLLFGHRDLLAGDEPALRPTRPVPANAKKVAILSGSFNPPTIAHQVIAERAIAQGCDASLLVLPASPAGKEPAGMIPEDRLLALRMAAHRSAAIVAATTHGLYVDQAEAAARAFPGADLTFLAGSDKVLQIFEPQWYEDRDAALERLFSLANFLVAPRGQDGPRLRACLKAPENRRFADAITVVPLHPSVADLSSTRVRGLLEAGADASGLVPPAVATLVHELQPFERPLRHSGDVIDAYRIRARLIDALWQVREWSERAADLRALMRLATAPTAEGAHVRRTLASDPQPDEIVRLQALAGA